MVNGRVHIGNTPTGVGKTYSSIFLNVSQEKHPHGRGEDRHNSANIYKNGETPPRAWGRLLRLYFARARNRNTPTGVGKTLTHKLIHIR
ncbi:conserved hypothetical protein [methanotrophic bacterial endosymbiont of Bathymodiolus sp.]|nr:conserved hypothetical protein [methanotrophic bacterial endosymbiont of Bathymodiolus sp.]